MERTSPPEAGHGGARADHDEPGERDTPERTINVLRDWPEREPRLGVYESGAAPKQMDEE
jgi:hypothetical protein